MIELCWPAKQLSPNFRGHWSRKAKAAKLARQVAGWNTKASGVKVSGEGLIDLHITFHPPDKRRRDLDNCIASMKSLLDGVADGLCVNDSRFRLHLEFGEVVNGGKVVVKINQ